MHAFVPKRHREYELIYVLSPTTTPAGATRIADFITEVVGAHEGKIIKVDLWGIRTLAYRIHGFRQGIYYFMRFIGTQGMVEELERRLRISEPVLRFLNVKASDRLVDPASYQVNEEEAKFTPIDEILARLASPEAEVPEGAALEGEDEAHPDKTDDRPVAVVPDVPKDDSDDDDEEDDED